MSSLAGHREITRRAVERLREDAQDVFSALGSGSVAGRVVARDLYDLLTLGHWRSAAQPHHFMRRFDGQSGREAYEECIAWIRSRATEAARMLALQLGKAPAAARPDPAIGARHHVTPSQAMGDALHALQDSFAPGHAEREAGEGSGPGPIRRILRYAGAEKAGHAAGDAAWRSAGEGGLSEPGRHAMQASSDLLRLIAGAAGAARAGEPIALHGFEPFRRRWLAVSAALSGERGRPVGFLRRFG